MLERYTPSGQSCLDDLFFMSLCRLQELRGKPGCQTIARCVGEQLHAANSGPLHFAVVERPALFCLELQGPDQQQCLTARLVHCRHGIQDRAYPLLELAWQVTGERLTRSACRPCHDASPCEVCGLQMFTTSCVVAHWQRHDGSTCRYKNFTLA